jgi:hypothetical protein
MRFVMVFLILSIKLPGWHVEEATAVSIQISDSSPASIPQFGATPSGYRDRPQVTTEGKQEAKEVMKFSVAISGSIGCGSCSVAKHLLQLQARAP